MRLVMDYPLAEVKPASYNPRAISKGALDRLKESLSRLGFVKPIIVRANGTILAGHQRTKAATAIGMTTAPAWVIDRDVTDDDEVSFNQLHNGTDVAQADRPVYVLAATLNLPDRFQDVSPEMVQVDGVPSGAIIRQEIAKLVINYGPWGCAIVDEVTGLVLDGAQYALTCRQLGIPVRVSLVDNRDANWASETFQQQYGVFSYAHVDKKPYVQQLAQPRRARPGVDKGGAPELSALYRKAILPAAKKGARVLDFGCGIGAGVQRLRLMGLHAFGIEFFGRLDFRRVVDKALVHRMIDDALANVERFGRFDAVISDYVLNSVQSPQMHDDVLYSLLAFTKIGGLVCLSGRTVEGHESVVNQAHRRSSKPANAKGWLAVALRDEDGFRAWKSGDGWLFQKYHTKEETEALCQNFGFAPHIIRYENDEWHVTGYKVRDLDPARTEEALRREFDLLWPDGTTVGRAEAAVSAWKAGLHNAALGHEGRTETVRITKGY